MRRVVSYLKIQKLCEKLRMQSIFLVIEHSRRGKDTVQSEPLRKKVFGKLHIRHALVLHHANGLCQKTCR
ncbi:hypothetical protein C7410_12285 [Paraburkholderia silvatlantica]|uniref:Uncharacterized protein n=1 Tax=Paraburkholderia silvatlantica TaxID=321895 RepID=A0A2V4TWA5_9BURK|nr:hypothetical protein C7410_12285 [Paraburkholderia silvatlantica]